MPFYFRKECPLNSGYLKQLSLAPLLSPFEQQIGFFCSLLAPSDAILFQEGVSVKLRLPQAAFPRAIVVAI
ncbi:hypothetical protein CBL20_25370 [Shigella flexneri]|uniref:hypothetical protein n=1 Tax=Shigella flexneri TaxID=623 RepID=UPI000B76797C|nr:hypothetical protein [Shigella flexneri]OUZ63343.1 hypothetical protein CBL20_25370 [Shigella flexneri]